MLDPRRENTCFCPVPLSNQTCNGEFDNMDRGSSDYNEVLISPPVSQGVYLFNYKLRNLVRVDMEAPITIDYAGPVPGRSVPLPGFAS